MCAEVNYQGSYYMRNKKILMDNKAMAGKNWQHSPAVPAQNLVITKKYNQNHWTLSAAARIWQAG
jgi:hypothetical protein